MDFDVSEGVLTLIQYKHISQVYAMFIDLLLTLQLFRFNLACVTCNLDFWEKNVVYSTAYSVISMDNIVK